MNHLDARLEQVALRLRHNAAMDTVDRTLEDERYELLWDVLVPPRRLLEASLVQAGRVLDRRNEQVAA